MNDSQDITGTTDQPGLAVGDVYRRLARRRSALLALAAALLFVSLLTDVMIGPAELTISQVLDALLRPGQVDSSHRVILWSFRLPTALFAVVIGAALGVAGAQMQTILSNPLASPYTLGVSAGASFGAALAMVCGAGVVPIAATFVVPTSAFVFAMLCSLAVYGVAHVKKGATEHIILSGVALLFLFNAGIGFLQYNASEDQLAAIVFWIFGSLQRATWPKLAFVSASLLLIVPIFAAKAWQLTALRMGDDRARSLGVDVRQLRLLILILVSVLTATAVCFVGAIGFIGLVAPHLARMMVGEDQRYFMPLSALAGASLLSVASIAGKLLIPGAVFPIGIATAFMGVPFFAAMVLAKRRSVW
jgi:iron complex transport system permease protein